MDFRRLAGIIAALLAGAAGAVQAKINGNLSSSIGDGLTAAAASFSIGLLACVAILALSPAARAGLSRVRTAVRTGGLRPAYLTGGLCGALVVASQTLAVAALGVAVFTIALVAGQSVASLAVDRAGIGPGG